MNFKNNLIFYAQNEESAKTEEKSRVLFRFSAFSRNNCDVVYLGSRCLWQAGDFFIFTIFPCAKLTKNVNSFEAL